MERARNYIIISAERESFSETIEHLQQKRRQEAKNKLVKFKPYLDQKHMLVRAADSNLPQHWSLNHVTR